jgi:hypothetical protein
MIGLCNFEVRNFNTNTEQFLDMPAYDMMIML